MSKLLDAFNDWRSRRLDRAYLRNDDARVADDLGVMRADLDTLAASPADTGRRMAAMAQAYGLDAGAIHAERWREAEMTVNCARCSERGRCHDFLDNANPRQDAPGDFCPNTHHFGDLIERMPQPSSK